MNTKISTGSHGIRLLRQILPARLINGIYHVHRSIQHAILKPKVVSFLEKHGAERFGAESHDIAQWLREHPLSAFPYAFTAKYDPKNIVVKVDTTNDLFYVVMNNKRLYFKRGHTEKSVQIAFSNLMLEQDDQSPHRYLDDKINMIAQGDIVIDAGAAEGMFSLTIIDRIAEVYIIECDASWIEALNYTFAPYRDKVHIINRFVSDKIVQDRETTLDAIMGNCAVNFIKADIEGYEMQMLHGAKRVIENSRELQMAICAYHREQDERAIRQHLSVRGFTTKCSCGYMLFYDDPDLKPPYLRHGLIRAIKQ